MGSFCIIFSPWWPLGHPGVPRRFRSRFWLHFGVPLGALGAPFGEPFRSLWPPWGPKKRKKRRFGGCLFAGPIFDPIFFTFRVPWTPKTTNSVWERYTKPHFRPRPKKPRFRTYFGVVLRTILDHVASLWVIFAARGPLFCESFRIDFSIDFSVDFKVPPPPQKQLGGTGGEPLATW